MKRFAKMLAIVAGISLSLTPGMSLSAPPYVSNTVGTTANGQLDALTDIYGNQINAQANPGSDSTKAVGVQGVTGGKAVPVNDAGGSLTVDCAGSPCATAAGLTTINVTLGTPFQAGGSIGNSSFGISGTLPAFAAIPAFKVDQTTPGTTNLVAAGQSGTWNIGTLSTVTGGGVASGATDSGNPIKIGAPYNSTLPTFTTGQRGDLQIDSRGNTRSLLVGGVANGADGQANSGGMIQPYSAGSSTITGLLWGATSIFNGATWDRTRTVTNGTDSVGTGIQAAGVVAQCDDTSPNVVTENQFGNVRMTCGSRALLVRPFEAAANSWTANVSLTDGTSTALHASCGSGLKNYLTWWSWSSVATTMAVTISILDGASTKFDDDIAAGAGHSPNYEMPSPIAGTAATALNAQLSGLPTGAIKVRAGGYCAA